MSSVSVLNIYHNSPVQIRKAMQPYGYFNPQIKSSYQKRHGIWYLHFHIRTGVRSIIRTIEIKVVGQGATDQSFAKAVERYKANQGQYFTLSKYEDGKTALLSNAANFGYFNAKIAVSHMYVDVASNTVKIKILLDTGIRYRFGPTDYNKNPFNKKFLQKYVAYKQGEYYTIQKVQKTQNNFSYGDYFDQIVVTPEVKNSVNGVTPMHVQFKMRPQRVYTFGLGYNTDTQINALAGFKYRWVNSWGHYFNARAQGSFVNYTLATAYNIPWPNPMKDLFTLRGALGKLDISRGNSNSYILSVLYKHIYTRWQHTISFNYLNERYNMYELPRTRARLFYPDARLSYFSTKNHINPDTGIRFTADLSGTPSALSSTSGFSRVTLGSKAVVSFLKYEQIVGRLEYGRIYINDINNLPLSLQFLIGGSQTVRGYSYQSIGPGRNMLYGTVEYRQRVWNELYIAGFYDFGNVTDNRIFGGMQESAGPSILYRSPIGVIQISIPWRLSAHHIRPRFVFSIGPEL